MEPEAVTEPNIPEGFEEVNTEEDPEEELEPKTGSLGLAAMVVDVRVADTEETLLSQLEGGEANPEDGAVDDPEEPPKADVPPNRELLGEGVEEDPPNTEVVFVDPPKMEPVDDDGTLDVANENPVPTEDEAMEEEAAPDPPKGDEAPAVFFPGIASCVASVTEVAPPNTDPADTEVPNIDFASVFAPAIVGREADF